MITKEKALEMCKTDNNYYLAWTYAGCENEREWPTKKEADEHKYRVNVPEYAKTKAEADRFWPTKQYLYVEKWGLERNVIVTEVA